MSQLSAFKAELTTLIESTWEGSGLGFPPVGSIARANQRLKENWANVADQLRLHGGTTRGAWAIIDIDAGAMADGKLGADSFGRFYTVGIWYVLDLWTDSPGNQDDDLATVEAALEAFVAALENTNRAGAFTTFQLVPGEVPTIDSARKNEANEEMEGTNMSILGGVVTFRALIGRISGT